MPRRTRRAEARTAELGLQRARVEAAIPAPATAGAAGGTAMGEGTGFIAELLAYAQAQRACADIAAIVEHRTPAARVLVVEDRALSSSSWAYAMVAPALSRYHEKLTSMLDAVAVELDQPPVVAPEPWPPADPGTANEMTFGPAVGAVAGSVVGAGIDLYALFRTDHTVSARTVALGSTPLVVGMIRELLRRRMIVGSDTSRALWDSPIVTTFHEAQLLRAELLECRNRLASQRIAPAQARLDALVREHADTSAREAQADRDPLLRELVRRIGELTGALGTAKAVLATVDALLAGFDAFAAAATAVSEHGPAPLQAAALRETLCDAEPTYTHVLYVGMEAAGGETVVKKGLFRRSGRVGYLGGCQVSYLLATPDGTPAAAGSRSYAAHLTYDLDTGTANAPSVVEIGPGRPPAQRRPQTLWTPSA
ncbi:MAG TPA: hypothetical protein VI011_15655 [Asanoa sp.]